MRSGLDGVTTKTLTLQIDGQRPTTTAYAAKVKHNRKVSLRYKVRDALPGCGSAAVKLKIYKGAKLKKTLSIPSCLTNATHSYKWRCTLPKGIYKVRVYATDLAGNAQSKVGSAKLTVK